MCEATAFFLGAELLAAVGLLVAGWLLYWRWLDLDHDQARMDEERDRRKKL